LTSREVTRAEFATVRLKEGYDMPEVDDFLDRVVETLTGHERSMYVSTGITATAVQNQEFTTVRIPEGYDMREVDEFLNRVVETFLEYEKRSGPIPVIASVQPGEQAGTGPGMSTFELVQQLLTLYAGAGSIVEAQAPNGRTYGIETVKVTPVGLTLILSD
jgi:DivIVA domain-containing protein